MVTQEKPGVITAEDRTPLNLLSIIASADPKLVFKSAEYKMLYDFIEKYFDYGLSIAKLYEFYPEWIKALIAAGGQAKKGDKE